MAILSQEINCVAKRLRQARLESGLSQKILGKEAGISLDSASARVNQFETGKHMPHIDIVEKLGQVLNAPLSYFYEKDDEVATLLLRTHRLPKQRKKKVLTEWNNIVSEFETLRTPSKRKATAPSKALDE